MIENRTYYSLLSTFTCALLVVVDVAVALDNYECVSFQGPTRNCVWLSKIQCGLQEGQGDCVHCDGAAGLPQRNCVAVEGGTCNAFNPPTNCGPKSSGQCNQLTGNCDNLVPGGTCEAVYFCNP